MPGLKWKDSIHSSNSLIIEISILEIGLPQFFEISIIGELFLDQVIPIIEDLKYVRRTYTS